MIAGAAAATSVALAVVQWPRPPALDGERWFKIALATLLRGQIEASEQGAAEWAEVVRRFVPYHPAGRLPERKVSNPVTLRPTAALPGEIALVEALDQIQVPAERWARLYDDEAALEARLTDPAELGEAYDPRTTLGSGADWEALAAWGGGQPGILEALERAMPATWVLVKGREGQLGGPTILPALAAAWASTEVLDGDPSAVRRRLEQLAEAGTSMVLVGEEAGVTAILDLLADNLAVRDRTLAVVSVGGVIGGKPAEKGRLSVAARQDWLQAHFNQRTLETEVVRLTPYFSVQWLDRTAWPPGVHGQPIEHARFPEPSDHGATATTTEVVDLGVLPADEELPTDQVARALLAVVAAWVVHRR